MLMDKEDSLTKNSRGRKQPKPFQAPYWFFPFFIMKRKGITLIQFNLVNIELEKIIITTITSLHQNIF